MARKPSIVQDSENTIRTVDGYEVIIGGSAEISRREKRYVRRVSIGVNKLPNIPNPYSHDDDETELRREAQYDQALKAAFKGWTPFKMVLEPYSADLVSWRSATGVFTKASASFAIPASTPAGVVSTEVAFALVGGDSVARTIIKTVEAETQRAREVALQKQRRRQACDLLDRIFCAARQAGDSFIAERMRLLEEEGKAHARAQLQPLFESVKAQAEEQGYQPEMLVIVAENLDYLADRGLISSSTFMPPSGLTVRDLKGA